MNKRRKVGWISLISALVIVLILIVLSYSNMTNLIKGSNVGSNDSESSDEMSDGTKQQVKKVQNTVGKEHQEIGKLIAAAHKFYNKTTGYGAIKSLDWDEQREEAALLINQLNEEITKINDEALLTDIQKLKNLAEQILNEEEKETVIHIHRLVHDLDIALNDYSGYDKIWNVTETLKQPGDKAN